ncbi:uncharacterized protein PHALS_14947 [Plasmopara halstedii]|uniref:Uncharacterized protein n=1 Tax=Plasmopara halstedii TaxID=4781 RepID=A0A0P1B0V0_PLAHL|nr:uncharacterized protein PHALS_14947 [Plasmopara halstedii]CEG46913.1 hypothetical protein PHALS_14947 [Plasmopara halstedii]|eukprot:XP_024583282.1 hypothetical protein PHALS_14947 [Plasmopara halstedii]
MTHLNLTLKVLDGVDCHRDNKIFRRHPNEVAIYRTCSMCKGSEFSCKKDISRRSVAQPNAHFTREWRSASFQVKTCLIDDLWV